MWNRRQRSTCRPTARRSIAQALEGRRLLASAPASGDWADASDTYTLTATSSTGIVVNAAPVTSVKFEATATTNYTSGGGFSIGKPNPGTFQFTLPSGPATFPFFDAINFGKSFPSVRIDSYTSAGLRRASWTLSGAYVTAFTQETAPNGGSQDRIGVVFKQLDMDFVRYDASGVKTDSLPISWDVPAGTASGPTTFDGTFLATKPDVLETMEFGLGQTPISNLKLSVIAESSWTKGGGASVGKPVGQDLTYDAPDGRNMFPTFRNILVGTAHTAGIYTRRDPATGEAVQRDRFGTLFTTKYGFSDTIFDNQPRMASVALVTPRYQLANFTYSGKGNAIQSVTSTGIDYQSGQLWNNAINSAHVLALPDERVAKPIDELSFRLISPLTLKKTDFVYENIDPTNVSLSSPDGGTTWIFQKLAGAQTSDGKYAIKLFADRVNALQNASATAGLFIGSTGKTWTLDSSGPIVLAKSFSFDGVLPTPYSFDFSLSEPVVATTTDGTVPVLIRQGTATGPLVTTAMATVDADGVSFDAHLAATLADGRYVATVPAGSVRDSAGNLLSGDVSLPFFVLGGDANRDAKVDFDDLLILAKHYNQTGLGYADGNFDYSADGKVDFSDLLILAKHYNVSLPAAAPVSAPAAAEAAAPTRRRTADDVLA